MNISPRLGVYILTLLYQTLTSLRPNHQFSVPTEVRALVQINCHLVVEREVEEILGSGEYILHDRVFNTVILDVKESDPDTGVVNLPCKRFPDIEVLAECTSEIDDRNFLKAPRFAAILSDSGIADMIHAISSKQRLLPGTEQFQRSSCPGLIFRSNRGNQFVR